MKKFLLLMTMFVASWGLMAQTNPSASELQQNSIEFNWTGGNEQSSGTQWYKVDLSVVPAGENLMLFLDNLTSEAATVTVRVALVTGTTAQIQNDATTTKTIDPNRLYAKEIAHNLFGNMQTVYVELTTNKHVHFYVEGVEPGEKDVACLNGVEFNRAGTTHQAGEKVWYKVDLSDVAANTAKSIKLTVKNNGNSAANAQVGLSFDCPSTGITNKQVNFSAGEI